MRTAVVAGGALALVVAAFLLLPKAALRLSGRDSAPVFPTVNAARLPSSSSPAAGGGQRFEDFAGLQTRAGFVPLDPGVLPQSFTADGQYVAAGAYPAIVFAYRNGAGRYLVITEAPTPHTQAGTDSPRNRTGKFALRGSPVAGGPEPVMVSATVVGQYLSDDGRLLACEPDDPAVRYTCLDGEPHDIRFSVRGIDVLVAADQRDVPRDGLLQIAAGLR